MIKLMVGAIALAMIAGAASAEAATLVNKDTAAHKVVVVEGDARKEVDVQGAQEVTGLCASNCSVYIGSDPEPYDLAAKDKVEIQNGELYYQEEISQGAGGTPQQ